MKVMSMLDIDMSQTFFIEKNPERKNIRYCVQYVESSTEIIEIFDSVLNELIEKRENSSRRLIYSQTRNQCATIYNAFCSQLEDEIYKNSEPTPRLRLVEMFHGGTPEAVKKHVVAQLTIPDSCLRVVISTVAFGMGVDCSNVNESIHFGAPKSIEAYVQESGRIGRNGCSSISRILYCATQILRTRNVCSEQKKQLYELLHEYRKKLTPEKTVSLLGVQTKFYSFHISQVLKNCQHLFTLDDIYHYVEIWRKVYALNIFCILSKVFCDIVVNTDSLDLFDLDQSMDSLPDEWLSIRDDSQAEEFALWDSYMLQSSAECSQITVDDDNESMEQPLDQDSFTE